MQSHFLDVAIIEQIGGFTKAAAVLRKKLPTSKHIRSGDLGEVLATEYVGQKTAFRVPIKRLQYKDDPNMAMRGNDVIGIHTGAAAVRVLKVEAKSRESLAGATVGEASSALMSDSGRPKPSTLAFISVRLREQGRHDEARIVEELQTTDPSDAQIEHMVFTFSGNDPYTHLCAHSSSPRPAIARHMVGVVIPDHQPFIAAVFDGNAPGTA